MNGKIVIEEVNKKLEAIMDRLKLFELHYDSEIKRIKESVRSLDGKITDCELEIDKINLEIDKINDNLIQIQNPKSKRWVLIDKTDGKLLENQEKPYKNVRIINPKNNLIDK